MDQPDLDPVLHAQALDGLARINAISRTAATLWPDIARLARTLGSRRPLRLLDVACGGGDVTVALARRARREGVALEVSGCDLSSTALDRGRELARRAGAGVSFFELDVTRGALPQYDAVICSLFLHHLDANRVVSLLRALAKPPCRLLLVSDLVRSRLGYLYAWFGSRCLTRSEVVAVDALLSVRAAFTVAEITSLAERAGLSGVRVRRRFPQRFLLAWEREAS